MTSFHPWSGRAIMCVLLAAAVLASLLADVSLGRPLHTRLALGVRANHLVDASGREVRLLGVDFSGAEYACVKGTGIWDAPTTNRAVKAMTSWHINAVRIPLNEDCWLGINGVAPNLSGESYRHAIQTFVARLHAHHLYVILDLHWNAPGNERATGQQTMADADHAPAFWSSVASTLISDHALIFDLYNEPHDISWSCWLHGCGLRSRTAGMQQLVDAVRSTGARQPLMLGGLAYANDLSAWRSYLPTDPAGQLVASFHLYNFNECITTGCWKRTVAPVAAHYPVVTGELGEDDCAQGFIDTYMRWADRHGISYLGWTWNAWPCRSGPALISSTSGTPTPFGAGLRSHLARLARAARHRRHTRRRHKRTAIGVVRTRRP